MRFVRGIGLCGGAMVAGAAYLLWVRPWALHWGATKDEVEMHLPGDDLVEGATFEATRAVTIEAPPEAVWPWLVQIGRGRAGWYSYDRLDNEGVPSAREILPQHQHMEVGDVIAMSETRGQPQGPTVLALEPAHLMLWGDPDEPHRFTWIWVLNRGNGEDTRIITRVRCRFSLRRPLAGMPGWLFMLLMELADPIMMRKQLLNLKARVEATKSAERLDSWALENHARAT